MAAIATATAAVAPSATDTDQVTITPVARARSASRRSGGAPPVPLGRLTRRVGLAGALGLSTAALRLAIANAAMSRSGRLAPLDSERDRVAHLLRRAGFGYSHDDLDAFTRLGIRGTVSHLINYHQVPDDVDDRLSKLPLNTNNASELQRWWLLRMIYTKRPLQEKMTLFWHGLLVSAYSVVGLPQPTPQNPNPPNLMLNQNQFFRAHALDDFGSMVKGISRDPAMVVYLDSRSNVVGRPNENYARELFELFTLGIAGPDAQPNYTEDDVREAARAFTGWGLNAQQQFEFHPTQHDNGSKTVFGQTGNLNGDDIADLIMRHPSNAWYISKRLFEFFAYPNPSPDTLAPIISTYRQTFGNIAAVVEAILTSPAFYSPAAYRAHARAPVEYIAATARALRLETDAFGFEGRATRMSQTLFNPPSVAGWPGGLRWFNTNTWLERLNFANAILAARTDTHTQPVDLMGFVTRNGLDTPEKAVDYFLSLLVDGQVSPERRQFLVTYARDGNLWPPPGQPLKDTDPAVDRKLRGVVYLITTMPEFQLA